MALKDSFDLPGADFARKIRQVNHLIGMERRELKIRGYIMMYFFINYFYIK